MTTLSAERMQRRWIGKQWIERNPRGGMGTAGVGEHELADWRKAEKWARNKDRQAKQEQRIN